MRECYLCVARRENRAVRDGLLQQLGVVFLGRGVALHKHVSVHIDEPRQHRCIQQVDHFNAGRGAPPAVTDTILSFSIRMSGFSNGFSLLPSISLAARIAIRVGACPAARIENKENEASKTRILRNGGLPFIGGKSIRASFWVGIVG